MFFIVDLFQFLIGRLDTSAVLFIIFSALGFQFLIGRLDTEAKFIFELLGIEVSIPYR